MFTEKQVALVQQSWRAVLPVGDTFAELFYGKLFALDRSIAALFDGDLKDQGRSLTAMISVAVGSLHRPEKILYALGQLGRRHAAYGVRAEHFAVMETALLFALEHALIDVFTHELKEAWRAAYAFLSNAMLEGAGDAIRRSAPATTSR
jgi:hemoglobin-like flavoprotein